MKTSDGWHLILNNLIGEWFHGAPLGNGDLGALVMPHHKRIAIPLCKSDIWDERCDDGSGKRQSFMPFDNFAELKALVEGGKWDAIDEKNQRKVKQWKGKFCLVPAASLVLDTVRFEKEIEILEFSHDLDMEHGLAMAGCRTRVRRQHVETLVSEKHQVLALRMSCRLDPSKGNPFRAMTFGTDISLKIQPSDPEARVESGVANGVLWYRVRAYYKKEYVVAVLVKSDDVRVETVDGIPRLTAAAKARGEVAIFTAVVSSGDCADPKKEAMNRVRRAEAAGYARIRADHLRAWKKFWGASELEIPDQALLRQYRFGMYILASSSRRGFPMPGLQGLWSTSPAGSGWNDYTNDLNIQMNYWPVYAANHLELAWPYYDTIGKWLPELRRYAREYWGFRGVQFSCCASPDGIIPPGYLTTLHWAGHAAFVAQNYWKHYRYSRDEGFLRETAYPLMKECAEFYLDFLIREPSGRYAIWPSNTPEAGEGSYEAWGRNPTMDIALLRMLFDAIVESSKILGVDSEFAAQCRERLEHLPPYPMKNGHLIEMESKEFLYSHRHPGMLTPVYPCADVTGRLAERSIDRFIEKGRWLWCGFSPVWVAGACARVGRGEQARDLLQEFMEVYTHEQGGFHLNFDFKGSGRGSCGPKCFTNETNSGFSASLLEMLLQSQNGVVRVFPAVPKDWKDASFRNLRAEGAFLVAAERKNGKVVRVAIESERGGLLRVADPWREGILEIETKPGQTVHLKHRS